MRTVVARGALTDDVIAQTPVAPEKSKAAAYVASKPIKVKEKGSKPRDVIKRVQSRKASKSGVTAQSAAEQKKKKMILIAAIALAAIIVISVILIAVLVTRGSPDKGSFINPYATTTKVGSSSEYLGTVSRNIPTEVKNEGLDCGYPAFGYTLKNVIGTGEEQVAYRNQLIYEANSLATINTANAGSANKTGAYNIIKADGSLYLNDEPAIGADGKPRTLYKHTASVGMYLGDVADDEQAIIKKITFMPRAYTSYYDVTGLYAPAGEVIKVRISEEDMNATNGITLHIGQALYNGQANNIWTAKNAMNRMPVILNTIVLDKNTTTLDSDGYYTGYIGSFLGGPIYVRDERVTFSVIISGGVRYSHFILGYTTPEEFEENAKSSAPYFDLEVWDNGVLQSGPKVYAQAFTYDDLYDAAILWDKISLVSNKVTTQGIVFLYDSFVAAGGAVAFPGRRSVNCPMDWMTSALNYMSFVKSGAWGNMHEFNHNYQGWGRGSGGEVTNNALSLVEYSLFTKISAARSIGAYGAAGLSGWNRYTVPTWAITQSIGFNGSGRENDLSNYAAVLHSFGQEMFIQAIQRQRAGSYGESMTSWCRALSEVTHNDFTYFYNDMVSGYSVSSEWTANIRSNNWPVFVPVASVYQTGRSYTFDGEKRYITTARPYVIPYGEEFEVDLGKYVAPSAMYESGSIVLPDGFTYTIKNVSQPEHGSIEKLDEFIYKYVPSTDSMESGRIIVTLGITKNDGAYEVEDIDLIIEFEQTHELNKLMLERTTYKFAAGSVPTSAVEAFQTGYAGYTEKLEGDNANKTQNSNTDIWYTNKDGDDVPLNCAVEVKGKIYIDETTKYRIALRGRWNCALFISTDGENYELAATYVQTNTANFTFPNTIDTYKDLNLNADTWLYFKAVMLTDQQGSRASFIGVGWGKFTPSVGILDEDGNPVGETEETVIVGYASAYRMSYEFSTEKFTSEYFYTRDYSYSYSDIDTEEVGQQVITYQYTPWDTSDTYKIENLFDGNTETYIHNGRYNVSDKPFLIVVKLDREITANRLTFIGALANNNAKSYLPKKFRVWVSTDGENWTLARDVEASTLGNWQVVCDFDEAYTFSYYRVEVTDTHSTSYQKYIALSEIEFSRALSLPNGKQINPDNEIISYTSGWSSVSCASTFGHVIAAQKKAKAEFEFTGTRFAIMSRNALTNSSFEVYIDGVKAQSTQLSGNNSFDPSFLSLELSSGKHKITVVSTAKGSDIDSILVWDNSNNS